MNDLERFLEGDPGINSIKIVHRPIDTKQVALIATALLNNTTLTSLKLRNVGIDSEGAESLAKALLYNKSLKKLDISWNEIGSRGAALIANAIVHNTTLTHLYIGFHRLGDETEKILANAVSQNGALLDVVGLYDVQIYVERNRRGHRRCRDAIWTFLLISRNIPVLNRDVANMIARLLHSTRADHDWWPSLWSSFAKKLKSA